MLSIEFATPSRALWAQFGVVCIKTEIHAPGFYEFCSLLQNSINLRWCAKGKTDGKAVRFLFREEFPRLADIFVNRGTQRFG